jgi:hypothetical protein
MIDATGQRSGDAPTAPAVREECVIIAIPEESAISQMARAHLA